MARVLRPGGPLLLVVSQPGLYASFLQVRWRYTAFTPAQVEQLMQQAGLRQVKVYLFRSGLPRRASFAGLGLKV